MAARLFALAAVAIISPTSWHNYASAGETADTVAAAKAIADGRFSDAIVALEIPARRADATAEIHLLLGAARTGLAFDSDDKLRKKILGEAKAGLDKAAATFPADLALATAAAEVFLDLGDRTNAEKRLTAAAALGDSPALKRVHARVLLEKKDAAGALDMLRASLAAEPSALTRLWEAEVLMTLKRYDEALDSILIVCDGGRGFELRAVEALRRVTSKISKERDEAFVAAHGKVSKDVTLIRPPFKGFEFAYEVAKDDSDVESLIGVACAQKTPAVKIYRMAKGQTIPLATGQTIQCGDTQAVAKSMFDMFKSFKLGNEPKGGFKLEKATAGGCSGWVFRRGGMSDKDLTVHKLNNAVNGVNCDVSYYFIQSAGNTYEIELWTRPGQNARDAAIADYLFSMLRLKK